MNNGMGYAHAARMNVILCKEQRQVQGYKICEHAREDTTVVAFLAEGHVRKNATNSKG
jgi:hypothetical protein